MQHYIALPCRPLTQNIWAHVRTVRWLEMHAIILHNSNMQECIKASAASREQKTTVPIATYLKHQPRGLVLCYRKIGCEVGSLGKDLSAYARLPWPGSVLIISIIPWFGNLSVSTKNGSLAKIGIMFKAFAYL